eukprot:m.117105 g.117105  ORF g.117105 m.117105 type:complete len:85 (-) comp13623_c1_seq8:138-392(-)
MSATEHTAVSVAGAAAVAAALPLLSGCSGLGCSTPLTMMYFGGAIVCVCVDVLLCLYEINGSRSTRRDILLSFYVLFLPCLPVC